MTRTKPQAKPKTAAKRQSGPTKTYSERQSRGWRDVLLRLGPSTQAWLEARMLPGERWATAIRRLAGMPPEDKSS